MKILILIAVVSCAVFAKADESKVKAVIELCKKEKPIKDDELAKIFETSQDLSKDAKCFRVCILEKQGLIDTQGHVNKAKIPDVATTYNFPADKVSVLMEAITKCDNKQGDVGDKCVYVDQVNNCIGKELEGKGVKA